MLTDLRHAMRVLARAPGFAAVAVITLALGIGGTSAVFALVRAVLLNPLPFPDADRLVSIVERRGGSRDADLPLSGHEFAALRRDSRTLAQVAVYRGERLNLTGGGEPALVSALLTSSAFFDVLGRAPAVGRTFQRGEDDGPSHRVVVLSDGFWRRRFDGDRSILGHPITLNDRQYTVIGVMPALPRSLSVDLWLPLDLPAHTRAVGRHNLQVIGRLARDAERADAQSELEAIARRLAEEMPAQNTDHHVVVQPLRAKLVGEYRAGLLLLVAAVGCVLLIACANIANLLLTRGVSRRKELAVRAAIGAGRLRLIRQLLTESLVLGVLSGAAGLIVAAWVVDLLPALLAVDVPLLDTARVDLQVAGATTALALACGLATGALPAVRVSRPDVGPSLAAVPAIADDRGGRRLRSLLIAAEIAWTLMLLICAGLMLNSFVRLLTVDPGFSTDRVLVIPVDLISPKYQQAERRRAFYDQLLERLAALPDVVASGAVSHLPLGGADNWTAFTIQGRPSPAPGQEPTAAFRVVSAGYFRALGIPLRSGRLFTAADGRLSVPVIKWFPQQPDPPGMNRPQAPPVALVSEAAARQYWPGQNPVGQRIRVLFSPEVTVVGVVGDVRHNGLQAPAYPHVYLPHNQEPWSSLSFVVRTSARVGDLPATVRSQVRALDPTLPTAVREMKDVKSQSVTRERFYLALISLFGAAALGLALVGIVGVVSVSTAERTLEIGVRIALGAQRREILALVMSQAALPIVAGLAAGVAGALAASRFIETLLYDVRPADPATFVAVVLLLGMAALVAAWIPARRAARLDPIVALRSL